MGNAPLRTVDDHTNDIEMHMSCSHSCFSLRLTLANTLLQRHELWALHGDWVRDSQPDFGPGTAERFKAASQITQEQVG